jgi:hypothetical protein
VRAQVDRDLTTVSCFVRLLGLIKNLGRHSYIGNVQSTCKHGQPKERPATGSSRQRAGSAGSTGGVHARRDLGRARTPRELGPCAASACGPRDARLPRDGACGDAGRPYGAYGAAQRTRRGEVVSLCHCLNTQNSKKLNRSAQGGE